MVITIMGAVATFERQRIAERTKEGLAQARRNGTWLGKPPWGSKPRGRKGHRVLVVDEDLYATGKVIVRWKQAGHTWEAIHHHLREHDVTRPRSREDVHRGTGVTKEWTIKACEVAFRGMVRLEKLIADGVVRRSDSSEPE